MTRLLTPLLFALTAASAFAQTVVVSPNGPVRTLAAARDAARELRKNGAMGTIRVEIRGGTYALSEPLVLTPEDSNTQWVSAPGERVVISGGRAITGWQKGPRAIWTAPAGEPYFRQLFVNGRRAQRSRTPNYGFFRIDGASSQDKPFLLHYRGNEIKPAWAERGDVEVIALLAWADIRMPIVSVDEAAHTATLANNPRPSNKEQDARYYIENAPDALDSAGEWYLDRKTNTVSYWPVGAGNVTKQEIIAPAHTQLVRLEGAPDRGQFVRGVKFQGLEFAYTDWPLDAKGYADSQAAILTAPAAFEAVGAEDCAIEHCVFRELGGYAIWFGYGSKRNRVVANQIFDVGGGGGVKIGETRQRENEAEQNVGNTVADNHIHGLGVVFAPAVGVWVGQSSKNTIAHNHIHDLYYTAISVGWTWGYGPNQCKENIIEYNHLHDIGREVLSDMGAIYTLGMQPGTVIRNNLIHEVAGFTYGGWGIYPDEGSTSMLIENNIVYRCKMAGFHQHYGRENIVRNNIFAFNGDYQLMRTREEPHVSFTLEGNIVYFDHGQLLGSNWNGDKFKLDRNIYWDLRGPDVRFAGLSLAEWQQRGQDLHSQIADPLFRNAARFDFTLLPGSPALKMGFRQIDMSTVGPRVVPGVSAAPAVSTRP